MLKSNSPRIENSETPANSFPQTETVTYFKTLWYLLKL